MQVGRLRRKMHLMDVGAAKVLDGERTVVILLKSTVKKPTRMSPKHEVVVKAEPM
jgi:hypothetical protein